MTCPSRTVIISVLASCIAVLAVLMLLAGPARADGLPAKPSPPASATTSPRPAVPSPAPAPTPPAPSPSPATPRPSSPPATPSPAPAPAPDPGSGSSGCGLFFDVTCYVQHAINDWFVHLVKSAINPVLGKVGGTLLTTPRLDQFPQATQLWTASLVIANTCFVVLIMIGGLTLMGRETLQSSYTIKDIAPRLVVGMVAANLSLLIIGKAIDFANGLSTALLGPGLDPSQAGGAIAKAVAHAVTGAALDANIFFTFIAIAAIVLGLVLSLIYVVRVMLTILLIAAAPLFAACHALPQTEGLAKLWWRALAGVLAIQIAQALVFIAALRIFFTPDMVATFGWRSNAGQLNLYIAICLLYILIRIPFWISRLVWRGGMSRSPIMHAIRTIAAIVIFRKVMPAIGGRGGTGRATARPVRPPRPRPTPSLSTTAGRQWVQPELSLGWPAPHATQPELPLANQPQPQPAQQRWTQLRLPGYPARPARWEQPSLFAPRSEQPELPLPAPRSRPVQPELPLAFPQRGSPEAGRSPRRAADLDAMRHAQNVLANARERQRRHDTLTQQQQPPPARPAPRRRGGGGTGGGRRRR